jgi:hypothetical protein
MPLNVKNVLGDYIRGNLTSGDPIKNLENFGESELGYLASDPASSVIGDIRNTADRGGMESLAAEARNNAARAADVDQGTFNRSTEGMSLSGRQRKAANLRMSLTRQMAKASAGTASRRATTQRSRDADRALGFGFENAAFGQQIAGLTGLANAEGQRQIRLAQERASKKAAKNSLIGNVVGTALAIFSSEDYKSQTEEAPKLLDKLKKVRVDKWKYKGGDAEHIGPYAEEFNRTFGVGTHTDAIDVVSMLGVTLGAVKELNEKVEARG